MSSFRVTKGIASLLCLVFTCDVVLANQPQLNFWRERHAASVLDAPLNDRLTPNDSARNLPSSERSLTVLNARLSEHGSVREIERPRESSSGRVVIHIHDVHRNLEAQAHIGQAVRRLIEDQSVDLIALEGAFDDIDLAGFQKFPERGLVLKVADYLLRENEISGPIHTALTTPTEIPIVGVDDRPSYQSNVDAYKRSVPLVTSYKSKLASKSRDLKKDKRMGLNFLLSAFDSQVDAYQAGEIQLGSYARFLSKHAPKTPESVSIFLEALEIESRLNHAQVESERSRVISQLVRRLSAVQTTDLMKMSAAYRMGQVRYAQFYSHLRELCSESGIDLARYPSMNEYLRYVLLSDGIDAEKIFNDIRELEQAGYSALIQTPHEKRLVEESRQLRLIGKLLDFSLTENEWKEYRSSAALQSHFGDLSPFENFYRHAKDRDGFMASNLLREMDRRKASIAVLVTGGFHSNGIESALRRSGITTVAFVPRITKIESEAGSAYLSAFMQEKAPLEKLFDGERLFVSMLQTEHLAKAGLMTASAAADPDFAIDQVMPRSNLELERKEESEGSITATWRNARTGIRRTIQIVVTPREILRVVSSTPWGIRTASSYVVGRAGWFLRWIADRIPDWLHDITWVGFHERKDVYDSNFAFTHDLEEIQQRTGFSRSEVIRQLLQNQRVLLAAVTAAVPILIVLNSIVVFSILSGPLFLKLCAMVVFLIPSVLISALVADRLLNPIFHDGINAYRLATGGVPASRRDRKKKEKKKKQQNQPPKVNKMKFLRLAEKKIKEYKALLQSPQRTIPALENLLREARELATQAENNLLVGTIRLMEQQLKLKQRSPEPSREGEEPATDELREEFSPENDPPLRTHALTDTPPDERNIWTRPTVTSLNYLRESRRMFFHALQALIGEKIVVRLKPYLRSPADVEAILEVGAGGGALRELSLRGLADLFPGQTVPSWLETDRLKAHLEMRSSVLRRTQVVDLLNPLPFATGSRRSIVTLAALDTLFLDQLPGVLAEFVRVVPQGASVLHVLDVNPQLEIQQQAARAQGLEFFAINQQLMPNYDTPSGYLLIDWKELIARYPEAKDDELLLRANEYRWDMVRCFFQASVDRKALEKVGQIGRHLIELAKKYGVRYQVGESSADLHFQQLKTAAEKAGLTVVYAGLVREQYVMERRDLPGLPAPANTVMFRSGMTGFGSNPLLKELNPGHADPVFVDVSIHLFHAVNGEVPATLAEVLRENPPQGELIENVYMDVNDPGETDRAVGIFYSQLLAFFPPAAQPLFSEAVLRGWFEAAPRGKAELQAEIRAFRDNVIATAVGLPSESLDRALASVVALFSGHFGWFGEDEPAEDAKPDQAPPGDIVIGGRNVTLTTRRLLSYKVYDEPTLTRLIGDLTNAISDPSKAPSGASALALYRFAGLLGLQNGLRHLMPTIEQLAFEPGRDISRSEDINSRLSLGYPFPAGGIWSQLGPDDFSLALRILGFDPPMTGANVLSLCGGDGEVLRRIRTSFKDSRLVLIDANAANLNRALSGLDRQPDTNEYEIKLADARRGFDGIPYPDQTFDFIAMTGDAEFGMSRDDLVRVLSEALRVLKQPGGRFLIETTHFPRYMDALKEIVQTNPALPRIKGQNLGEFVNVIHLGPSTGSNPINKANAAVAFETASFWSAVSLSTWFLILQISGPIEFGTTVAFVSISLVVPFLFGGIRLSVGTLLPFVARFIDDNDATGPPIIRLYGRTAVPAPVEFIEFNNDTQQFDVHPVLFSLLTHRLFLVRFATHLYLLVLGVPLHEWLHTLGLKKEKWTFGAQAMAALAAVALVLAFPLSGNAVFVLSTSILSIYWAKNFELRELDRAAIGLTEMAALSVGTNKSAEEIVRNFYPSVQEEVGSVQTIDPRSHVSRVPLESWASRIQDHRFPGVLRKYVTRSLKDLTPSQAEELVRTLYSYGVPRETLDKLNLDVVIRLKGPQDFVRARDIVERAHAAQSVTLLVPTEKDKDRLVTIVKDWSPRVPINVHVHRPSLFAGGKVSLRQLRPSLPPALHPNLSNILLVLFDEMELDASGVGTNSDLNLIKLMILDQLKSHAQFMLVKDRLATDAVVKALLVGRSA